jgi:DNA-binding transcriptional LysR family regulator
MLQCGALGIVTTSNGSCRREMDNGSLVRVLEDWDLGSMELSAVLAGDRTTKHAARAFTDHLIAELNLLTATGEISKRLVCPDRRPIG